MKTHNIKNGAEISVGSIRAAYNAEVSSAIRIFTGVSDSFLAYNPLSILDDSKLEKITETETENYKTLVFYGDNDWCTYKIAINLDKINIGAVKLTLDTTLKHSLDINTKVITNKMPELSFRNAKNEFVGSDARFYFDIDVPIKPINWNWRSDLNQFVYFGDKEVLNSTVLYYSDFTDLDNYFVVSGTEIFNSIQLESHDDTVVRPGGARGSQRANNFNFGFKLPLPQKVVEEGQTLRLSSATLSIRDGVPEVSETVDSSKRFIESYLQIFNNIKKPEFVKHDWMDYSEKLLDEMNKRKASEFSSLVTELNFSVNSYYPYYERYNQDRLKMITINGKQRARGHYREDFVNDFGSKYAFGWYTDKESWAKCDFWQAYLWPIIQALEFAVTVDAPENDKDFVDMLVSTSDVLIDTGRTSEYVFNVFMDINTGQRVKSEYDTDYGATGAYAYAMMLYYELTGDEKFLNEAKTAADRLAEFGVAIGFEINVTSASCYAMYKLFELTGEQKYLDYSYIQLAGILKHTWLFNPSYERFAGRTLFMQTSARANLCYANAAEEGCLARYLTMYLGGAEGKLEQDAVNIINNMFKYKSQSNTDSFPIMHEDKSLIETKPVHWKPHYLDGHMPMEPFGYSMDSWKLGALNECTYGINMVAEFALMQNYTLNNGDLFFSEIPVDFLVQENGEFTAKPYGYVGEYVVGIKGDYNVSALDTVTVKLLDKSEYKTFVENDVYTYYKIGNGAISITLK